MNREEILNMSAGREMDALIAEKVTRIPFRTWYAGEELSEEVPHYSTDISDAWIVVEKLRADGGEIQIRWDGYPPTKTDRWSVFVVLWKSETKKVPHSYAESEYATLAICRAALLAVMEEE